MEKSPSDWMGLQEPFRGFRRHRVLEGQFSHGRLGKGDAVPDGASAVGKSLHHAVLCLYGKSVLFHLIHLVNSSIRSSSVMDRSTRQGTPAATLLGGIFRVTTLPAPMTLPSPMVTPPQMVTLPPIQQ